MNTLLTNCSLPIPTEKLERTSAVSRPSSRENDDLTSEASDWKTWASSKLKSLTNWINKCYSIDPWKWAAWTFLNYLVIDWWCCVGFFQDRWDLCTLVFLHHWHDLSSVSEFIDASLLKIVCLAPDACKMRSRSTITWARELLLLLIIILLLLLLWI